MKQNKGYLRGVKKDERKTSGYYIHYNSILIIVIMLEVPWFYVYLIWIIAIGLIIAGVYLLILKNRY